ncbi:MAG: hypothetical protein IPP74_07325 [Alphaproteobacteria bacterium]|nr:hypothetical protein [Alphaproteobacteria bacterium]
MIGEGVGDAAHQAGFTLDQSATIGQFSALGVAFLSGGDASSIQISNATALQAINFNLLLSKSTFAGEFLDSVGKGMNEGNELVNGYLVEITPKWMKDALVSLGGVAKKGANFTVEKMDAGLRNALGDEQIDTLYTYVGAKRDAAGNWLYDQFTPDQLRAIIGFGAVYLGPVFAPENVVAGTASKAAEEILGVKTVIEPKILDQMIERGWNEKLIDDTILNPLNTVEAMDTRFDPTIGKRLNDPATGYIGKDGSYVVKNNVTGQIVQISDRNKPDWKAPWNK